MLKKIIYLLLRRNDGYKITDDATKAKTFSDYFVIVFDHFCRKQPNSAYLPVVVSDEIGFSPAVVCKALLYAERTFSLGQIKFYCYFGTI